MPETKVRILGIVPYESMRNVMLHAAENIPEVSVDVYVGNLREGMEAARRNLHKNYDVILSRGGTVDMIRKVTSVPVIDIPLTSFDILRTIELAQNISERFVVVAFPNITKDVKLLTDILQYNIQVITIHSEEEVQPVLEKLRSEGTPLVISDTITNITAHRINMRSVLLTSGAESLNSALQQAVALVRCNTNLKSESALYRTVLSADAGMTVVYDQRKTLVFSSWNGEGEEFYTVLRQNIPDVAENGSAKFFHVSGRDMYSITGRLLHLDEGDYTAFYIQEAKVPMISSKYGVSFSARREAEQQYFNSCFSMRASANDLEKEIRQYSGSDFPIMITGEPGTGKDQAARLCYLNGRNSSNPYVTVSCSILTAKSWEFITNHYNSPLNDSGLTICFQDIDELSGEWSSQLLSLILDMGINTRNHLIFTCACGRDSRIPPHASKFLKKLSCLEIHLEPIRARREELASVCSLYLANQNMEMGRQIIGFDAGAMDLMLKYDWPGNFTQLKRVINALCVMTSTSYIRAASVKRILEQEARSRELWEKTGAAPAAGGIDLNRTLEQILSDVIRRVVEEKGGNQSAAARQLGISRTTLWRYLNRGS